MMSGNYIGGYMDASDIPITYWRQGIAWSNSTNYNFTGCNLDQETVDWIVTSAADSAGSPNLSLDGGGMPAPTIDTAQVDGKFSIYLDVTGLADLVNGSDPYTETATLQFDAAQIRLVPITSGLMEWDGADFRFRVDGKTNAQATEDFIDAWNGGSAPSFAGTAVAMVGDTGFFINVADPTGLPLSFPGATGTGGWWAISLEATGNPPRNAAVTTIRYNGGTVVHN
jgi:hypothetical protein